MLYEILPAQWKKAIRKSEDILKNIELLEPYIPAREYIFKAFELSIDDIKICIIGQDPYPNPEHAMGLAFSVPEGVEKLPPTLRNILKELESDVGVQLSGGDLSVLSTRGVFLLNRVLTTQPGQSQGHNQIGWQEFTSEVIKYLAEKKIVFILWGKSAGELAQFIPDDQLIVGVHPSPLSVYRGFYGSKPFSTANEKLRKMGVTEIDWKI